MVTNADWNWFIVPPAFCIWNIPSNSQKAFWKCFAFPFVYLLVSIIWLCQQLRLARRCIAGRSVHVILRWEESFAFSCATAAFFSPVQGEFLLQFLSVFTTHGEACRLNWNCKFLKLLYNITVCPMVRAAKGSSIISWMPLQQPWNCQVWSHHQYILPGTFLGVFFS